MLHWAGLQGRALKLKRALLQAYHVRGENPARLEVLLKAAGTAGLDEAAGREVLDSGACAAEVRESVRQWQQRGITSVPSVVFDGRHLIVGGQPAEVFEQMLRRC